MPFQSNEVAMIDLGEIRVGGASLSSSSVPESADNCIFAQCFLMPAHFVKLGISVQNILNYDCKLGYELPVAVGGNNL